MKYTGIRMNSKKMTMIGHASEDASKDVVYSEIIKNHIFNFLIILNSTVIRNLKIY